MILNILVQVTADDVIDVLRCADFLQFHQVVHLCSTFLQQHITADTCLQVTFDWLVLAAWLFSVEILSA